MSKLRSQLDAELATLANLPVAELRKRWEALEGSLAPALAAPLLRRLVAQRLQERRHPWSARSCGLFS